MNEFQQTQDEMDMQALREAVPNWKSQPLPPRDSLANDVQLPTWNKVKLDPVNSGTSTGGGVNSGSARVIVAFYNGTTYVPKVMIPVDGTLFEDP